jgi:protein involved in polysaccharide export with SLBB domain
MFDLKADKSTVVPKVSGSWMRFRQAVQELAKMRKFLLVCALAVLWVSVPATAQDTGAGSGAGLSGQGTQGQNQQSMPIPMLPVPQVPTDQNTIRNNPYDELIRAQQMQQQGAQLVGPSFGLPQEQSQFQLFIAESLGQMLPIYGHNFFSKVPSTFAPVDQMPVPADYIIGPGDEVVIRAWGQVDVDYRDVVDRNGNLYVPKVGALHVAGLRYDQLHDYIHTSISRIFKNFQLNTSLGSLRSIQVYVVGYAAHPGGYTVSSMSTLVNAVFAAGGPAPNGSMRHILLRRGSEVVTDFDMYDLLLKGDKSKDHQLLPGDVIYFAPVGPQAALAGSVNQPAIYELRDKTTLGELINLAGGISPTASGARALVERIDGHQVRQVASIPLEGDGLKRELSDGDLINIAPISARFANAVTLRGNVASPGRHPWHAGMRVKDLIPDVYTLITEQYWLQQNEITRSAQWGKSLLNSYCPPGNPANSSNPACFGFQPYGPTSQGGNFGPGAPGNYPYSPQMQPYSYPAPGPYGPTGQYSPNAAYAQPNAGPVQGNVPSPLSLQGGYQSLYSPYQGPPFMQQGMAAGGTSTLAGVQQLTSLAQSALQLEIQRMAPDINWSYALIERLDVKNLTTELIPFNLRKALLDPDSPENRLLSPGDVVTIFSQEDMRVPSQEQSKFVYLEGELKTPGVYRAEPGETLRQLVERVGGMTPNAYLFGAEFTRESARKEQQMRLDQAINQFEQEVQRNAAEQASSTAAVGNAASAGTQQAAAFQTNLQSQQQLLDRLKQVRADGRIVLGVRPWDESIQALPDIPLEDGDRLVVPSRPSFVNVVGAVFNTSSYLYSKNLRTRDYLREAGGGTSIADPGRTFVVRADGSVISHIGGPFTGSIMSARLMPGDTVVVPEKLNKPGLVQNMKDWAYILGQFGLAAAAVNILK